MAKTTSIAWTDHTWSPWEGCTKISPACDHCYAARMNGWLKAGENWGPGAPRFEYSDEHWKKPGRWAAKAMRDGTRPKVFPSVCDPFDNEVRPELRAQFFDLIYATQPLTWLLLTKRIGNVPSMLVGPGMPGRMPSNVWLGATLANREEMLRDGPKLKAVSATVRFWSVEPMLGDLGEIPRELLPDWVICGGESGPGARRVWRAWIDSLRDQCAAAGVPFFFKQWGGRNADAGGCELDGAEVKEWPRAA
ncbi:MAG: DUF5131 family protein [Verrucomicrobia bacterium]|nr:MAG: DUF5131 family protein [Verrucomicrobiota bacterium]